MESSTAAWDRYEAQMELAQWRHDTLLRDTISTWSGRVFSTAGDGMGAVFDRVEDCLNAAVTAQRALAAEPWPTPLTVRVRMGMHTGEATERDGDYFGPDVIRAARLMALVDGGRIVCSRATRQAVTDHLPTDIRLLPVGTVRLKGLAAPEQVFAVSGPGLTETAATVVAPSRIAFSAPRPLNRLVGRDDDIEVVLAKLRENRLVTLIGIGGVGKTRLASAVARCALADFTDGVAWVELAPLTADHDVAQAVADVVHVREQPGEPLTGTVCTALEGRRLLLILDNCEHVSAGAVDLVAAIGSRCADVTVLTTSRERLGVDGESAVSVAPLRSSGPDAPALQLLHDRLDLTTVDELEQQALVEIAEHLDGLPLALELAAARCRSLGPIDVAARLGVEHRLLADRRPSVERHRTLEEALNWSYRLLDDRERHVLECVSLFAGSFELSSAELVVAQADGDDPVAVDEALAALVDKSLVDRYRRRFRLLQTTRQFAARRLGETGHRSDAQRRHTRCVVDQVCAIHDGLHGPDEARWVDVLDEVWPDVRTVMRRALAEGDGHAATMIAIHLAGEAFWRRPEALGWIREAVDLFGTRAGPHLHELLGAGGWAAWTLVDVPAALVLAERAMELDPAPGTALDGLPESAALGAYNFSGQFDKAVEVCRRALPVLQDGGDAWTAASMAANLALTLGITSPTSEEAETAAAVAIDTAIGTGNPTNLGLAYFSHATAVIGRDPAAALRSCDVARAYADEVRNQWLLSVLAAGSANALARAGDPEQSLGTMLATADELHSTGWTTHAWTVAWIAVVVLVDLGRPADAALLAGGCVASQVGNLGNNPLPEQIAALVVGTGSRSLTERYERGAAMSLPALLRALTATVDTRA